MEIYVGYVSFSGCLDQLVIPHYITKCKHWNFADSGRTGCCGRCKTWFFQRINNGLKNTPKKVKAENKYSHTEHQTATRPPPHHKKRTQTNQAKPTMVHCPPTRNSLSSRNLQNCTVCLGVQYKYSTDWPCYFTFSGFKLQCQNLEKKQNQMALTKIWWTPKTKSCVALAEGDASQPSLR